VTKDIFYRFGLTNKPSAGECSGSSEGRFWRLSNKTDFPLSLPIAKELVELHGGRLLIESTLGIGTTVKIELPRSRVLGVEATQGNEPAHINAAYEATRSTESFAPPSL